MTDREEKRRQTLEGWLSVHFGAETQVSELRRPGAGQSSETFLFEAVLAGRDRVPLVLRMQAADEHIFPTPDAVLESRVLQGLAGAEGLAVPRVVGAEADAAVLGVPFFVMSQVPGQVPQGKPSMHVAGWVAELAPDDRSRLWEHAMGTVVAVHAVPWRGTHAFLDPPGGASRLGRRVEWLAHWYRWATKGRQYPITDSALAYLWDAQPEEGGDDESDVLVWGDARVGNMIFASDHSVAAAVDWEVATIGRPEIDVAHWLFFDEFATTAVGVDRLPDWPDRTTTVARYEKLSGRRLLDLTYFDVMQELFMAITLIRQSDRRVALGLSAPESRMGHDNTVTQMLARRLGMPEPELSSDWLAHRGITSSNPAGG
jgi:aminoglycoside phosphotransferase (APT) family kinase protein